jgi:hypothetical protein
MRKQQVLALSYKRSNNGRRQEKVSWLLRRSMVDSLEIALNTYIDYVEEKLGKGQWEVGRKRVADVVFEYEMAQMDDGIGTAMNAKAKLTSWK